MISRHRPSTHLRPANTAQVTATLQRSGLSVPGIRQALDGSIVSDARDRAAIARILAAFASLPIGPALEIHDYPGAYAQRFDGQAEVKRD
jgi:hypothetical protein